MKKGLLVFCISNNHCMMPDDFFWSYQRMFKPNGSFAVKGSSSIKSSSINDGIYKALGFGAEWMFLMDVDQTFPRDTIPRLWASATAHNAKIISVLYHLGTAPYAPVAGWFKEGKNPECVNKRGEFWKGYHAPLGKGVVEVDWVGAGGLLIHKDVVEAVGWPAFEDLWEENRANRSYGHDVNFCLRAKEKGFKVYVDTDVCSDHGKFIYITREYAEGFNNSNIVEKMGHSFRDQTLESGYWDTVWETEHIRGRKRDNKEIFNEIADIVPEGAKVADMGCGAGCLMDLLKEKKGCECTGYDFSKSAIDICKKKGFDGVVADLRFYEPNGDNEIFDVVVATSVVEHLHKDIKFVRDISRLCKPGGKVIITTPSHPELQGCLEHIRGYNDEDIENLVKHDFEKFEVKKNSRDYLVVVTKR